jgi:tRNA(Ile)-lysidine synthetase-like protein
MGRVDPALAAARTAVRAELADLAPGDLVLVACSGGADSLALAGATAAEASRVGRSVRSRGYSVRAGAVVVDHGLQAGSAEAAAHAAAQCRELGLAPVHVRRVAVGSDAARGGLEAAAREARYAALDAVADETGAAAVLLGHTLDDQAESVLLGLARGSGARSLAGMPRRRGRYRRPFLGLRRAQTEAACAALGLTFWVDPTNLASAAGDPRTGGTAPLRSRVRAAVVPVLEDVLGPGAVEALARTADQLRDDADLLDALAADLLAAARSAVVSDGSCPPEGGGSGTGVLDVATLAAAPAALRRRALRAAALDAGCPPTATTARHVDALDALVVAWSGQGPAHLPGDARAWRACGRLFLAPARSGRERVPPASATPQE